MGWKPSFVASDVVVEDNELVYDGFYKMRRYQLSHRMFAGGHSPLLVREQICRRDAVAVLLFDPKRQTVVMAEQFRVGLMDSGQSPWMLEIIAGLIDSEETPEQTAYREAREEASCDILKLIPITSYYNTPGGFSEKTHAYCGVVDSKGKEGICGMQGEHEDIKVHVLALQEMFEMYKAGAVSSSATIIAMQWLQSNYLDKSKFQI